MQYLKHTSKEERDVCLIPTSAHGTNPASAAMAGMKIHKVNVLKNGLIDMNQFSDLVKKYNKNLACTMVTYPSTYGVFDAQIVYVNAKIECVDNLVKLFFNKRYLSDDARPRWASVFGRCES